MPTKEVIHSSLWDSPTTRYVMTQLTALSCFYEGSQWNITARTRHFAVTARSEELERGVQRAITLLQEKLEMNGYPTDNVGYAPI